MFGCPSTLLTLGSIGILRPKLSIALNNYRTYGCLQDVCARHTRASSNGTRSYGLSALPLDHPPLLRAHENDAAAAAAAADGSEGVGECHILPSQEKTFTLIRFGSPTQNPTPSDFGVLGVYLNLGSFLTFRHSGWFVFIKQKREKKLQSAFEGENTGEKLKRALTSRRTNETTQNSGTARGFQV